MIFFHVSPAIIKVGEFLETGKRGYVCLATSLKQALYWGGTLFGPGNDRETSFDRLVIYLVEVPDDEPVEECVGHYSFECMGITRLAKEVSPHSDLDGEVVVRRPVRVCRFIKVNPNLWHGWFQDYMAQVIEAMRKEAKHYELRRLDFRL